MMLTLALLASFLTTNFGRVSEVHGDAYLVNGEMQQLVPNFLIEPGDLVETDDGRVEVELNYGTVVWIGHGSKVWFHEISEDRRELEVVKGRIYVRNRNDASDVIVEIPQGLLRIVGEGALRVRVRKNGFAYVKVTDGRVEVETDEASTVLHEDEALELDPYGYITYRRYDFDEDFVRWCRRRERVYVTVTVVEYLPPGIWIGLVDLDLYGRWVWVPPYGWVWVPRTYVAATWRPYLYGHWVFYADIGWVWVSYEPWGWVPYHYGRWTYLPGHGWVWIPGSRFRGGWVAWHTHDGVVAWAPLGPDDRPVRVGRQTAWIAVSRQSFLHPRVPKPAELAHHPKVPYKQVRLARVPERQWARELSLKPSRRSPVWVERPTLAEQAGSRTVSKHRLRVQRSRTSKAPGYARKETWSLSREQVRTPGIKLRSQRRSSDSKALRRSSTHRLQPEKPRLERRSRSTPRDDRHWIRRSFESLLRRQPGKARKAKPQRPDDEEKTRKLPRSVPSPSRRFTPSGS